MTKRVDGEWFKLFASCIIVKGKSCSVISDIERSSLYDLPNDFLEVLELSKTKSIEQIKNIFKNELDSEINDFFEKFVKEEIGFYTSEPASFPEIDLTWDSPNLITNSIIEIDTFSNFDFNDIFFQLNSLGTKAIQLRFLYPPDIDYLEFLLHFFKTSRINHIEILVAYNETIKIEDLYELVNKHKRLVRIMIYSSPIEELIKHENQLINNVIVFFKKDIRVDSSEKITLDRFKTNIISFSEAQKHNLGLNRKICIDKEGYLKNYLTHSTSFGNIFRDKITDIVRKKEFQEKWFISNDLIDKCCDCQYRYFCVSNSDIIKEKGIYFKNDICTFNTNANTWEE
jgi:SPASM domain peptide maturase of grasp-with-spasm system